MKAKAPPKSSADTLAEKPSSGKLDINSHLQQLVEALKNSRPATKRKQSTFNPVQGGPGNGPQDGQMPGGGMMGGM